MLYIVFKEGDYMKCVQYYFNVNVVDDNGIIELDVMLILVLVMDENVVLVVCIVGLVGVVEVGSLVLFSVEGLIDVNGDKFICIWMFQDGKMLSGQDKVVVIFNVLDVVQNIQYVVNLIVSDGMFFSIVVYMLNVKVKVVVVDDEDKIISYFVWSSSQKWNLGDIVNSNGVLYQCKLFLEGLWCNVVFVYYEFGVGIVWVDVWNVL